MFVAEAVVLGSHSVWHVWGWRRPQSLLVCGMSILILASASQNLHARQWIAQVLQFPGDPSTLLRLLNLCAWVCDPYLHDMR
jgi:hypothetical protein